MVLPTEPPPHLLRYLSSYVRRGQGLAVGEVGTCVLWMLRDGGTYTRVSAAGDVCTKEGSGQALRASLYYGWCFEFNIETVFSNFCLF